MCIAYIGNFILDLLSVECQVELLIKWCVKYVCQCKQCCYCRVSGRGSVNTENTANVNTVIVECQVEVP